MKNYKPWMIKSILGIDTEITDYESIIKLFEKSNIVVYMCDEKNKFFSSLTERISLKYKVKEIKIVELLKYCSIQEIEELMEKGEIKYG